MPMRRFATALAALSAATVPAAAQAAEYDFRNLSEPVYTQFVTEEYNVPTEFGTIYGWVKRPVTPAGVDVPVILTYSPYATVASQTPGTDGLQAFYTPRGYARAFFHVVGTGWSGGCTDYGGIRERITARDVVDHLGSRDWSNGRVGMIGGSYDGTTQWAAAVEQPEHLATIVPQVAISRWYDYAYGQGVRFYSGNATPLAFDYGFNQAPVGANDPSKLPLGEKAVSDVLPCDNVDHQLRGYGPDPVMDGWWQERDYRVRADRVQVPALVEGSWTDYNVHPINSMAMWDEIEGDDPRHKLVMGLQGHGVPNFIKSATLHHAWFDRYLLGRDTGVEDVPRVQSQLSGNGASPQDSAAWPPAEASAVRLPLTTAPATGLEALGGGGATWTDLNPNLSESAAMSQSAPVASVVFRSAPATQAQRLVGTPTLTLRLTTNDVETQVTPVLFTETASGSRRVFTRGLLNSFNRDGNDRYAPLSVGRPWSGQVVFQPADHVLAEGERLGIALMSHNSNEAFYADKSRATNTLDLSGATFLDLTVAPAPPEE